MCHCCLGYVYTRRRLGDLLNSRGPGFQSQLRQLETIRESLQVTRRWQHSVCPSKLEVRKKQAAHCSVASVALARRATVRGEALGSLSLHRELVLAATFCAGFCGVLGGRRAALGAP